MSSFWISTTDVFNCLNNNVRLGEVVVKASVMMLHERLKDRKNRGRMSYQALLLVIRSLKPWRRARCSQQTKKNAPRES